MAGAAARPLRSRIPRRAARGDRAHHAHEPEVFRVHRTTRDCSRRRSSASPTSTRPTAARRSSQGNRRVLAARLSDARFFWEQDLKVPLEEQAKKLDGIVFHEKLGTVADKVERVAKLARWLVESGVVKADPDQVERAARLAKADLVTGMVGEFPELQGVIGGYLAEAQGEPKAVADAIRDHYAARRAQPVRRSLSRLPTSWIRSALSSASIRSRPARRTRSRFAARRSRSIEMIVGNRLRLSLTEAVRGALANLAGQLATIADRPPAGPHRAGDPRFLRRPAEGAAARGRRSARSDRCRVRAWRRGRSRAAARAGERASGLRRDAARAPTCSPPTSARPTS